MSRKLASVILLTLKGGIFLMLALVDWTTAKVNVSERGYLIPGSVAREFRAAIGAAWRGQRRQPSLLACVLWNRNACGPVPGDRRERPPYGLLTFPIAGLWACGAGFLLQRADQISSIGAAI